MIVYSFSIQWEDSCCTKACYDVAHRHAFQPCRIEDAGEIVPIHDFSWVVGAESMALLSPLSLEGSKSTVVKRLKYVCYVKCMITPSAEAACARSGW